MLTIPIPLAQWLLASPEARLNYLAMGMYVDRAELPRLAIAMKNQGHITIPQFDRLKAYLNGALSGDSSQIEPICLACYGTQGTQPCRFCAVRRGVAASDPQEGADAH